MDYNKINLYKQNLIYHVENNNLDKITKYIYKLTKPNNLIQKGGNIAVYFKDYNDIGFISLEEYEQFKDKVIYVPNYKLSYLINKNVKEIEKAMIDYDSTGKSYYHMSRNPIKKMIDTYDNIKENYFGNSIYQNPTGLWISCGDEWIKYTKRNEMQPWNMHIHLYEIKISDEVLKISNLKEFKNFIDKYKNKDNELTFDNVINWKKVKNDYDGLLICPYLGDKIWGKRANEMGLRGDKHLINDYIVKAVGDKWKDSLFFLAEWYRHWETGTGVIWKSKGVTEINLVKRMETFKEIEINNK